jgi:hypothetical protein
VPNLIHLDGQQVVQNKERVELRFEEIPGPTFDGLPMHNYLSPYPIIPVLQSRGCYWVSVHSAHIVLFTDTATANRKRMPWSMSWKP